MTEVALYTAIYGGYDWVKPLPLNLGVPAYLFTDDEETARAAKDQGWLPEVVPMPQPTSMLQHKWWKCHPHLAVPKADITLWIDGSMLLTVDDYVAHCLRALGDDDWCMVRHPARDCIYDEAYFSALLPRYDGPAVIKQAEYYRSIGHPTHWGLFATGANVRRHTDGVRQLNEWWWYENETRTHQDQVSLPVVTRIAGDSVKWNVNMPWGGWWGIYPHQG